MLFVLSPAKSLDFETPLAELPTQAHSAPLFAKQAKGLIDLLRPLPVQEVASLMSLSDKLAALNVARYAAWSSRATQKNARQAVLAFDGDVYDGLQARAMTAAQLDWLQEHLCILSGLYGVLRPLDLMQPYRLEMGTRLANPKGADLYRYWGSQIAQYLNERLQGQPRPLLVNLASQEYFKAVDLKALKVPVLECVFEDYKGGQYKIISFNAKRARGMMARFATEHRVRKADELRAFDTDGYQWCRAESTDTRYVFRRKA